jgi:hypothetical protein
MPPPNTEIPHDLRITIVVLRHLCGWKFQEIADKIELECRTVTQIFNRAKQRTPEGLQDSFMELIKHVDPKKRPGRRPIIAPNSPASQQLRQLFLEHFDLPIEMVTSHIVGLKMARSIAENVAHKHRDPQCDRELIRAVQPIKPRITFDIMDLRVQYADWVKQEYKDNAVFIFVDESYFHFGGHPRKKPKITKLKGADPTLFARYDPPEQFQLMMWGAIGPYEEEILFLIWIWEIEIEVDKKEAQTQLNELNSA